MHGSRSWLLPTQRGRSPPADAASPPCRPLPRFRTVLPACWSFVGQRREPKATHVWQFKRRRALAVPGAGSTSLFKSCLRLRFVGVRVVGVLDHGRVSAALGARSIAVAARGNQVPDQLPKETSSGVARHPSAPSVTAVKPRAEASLPPRADNEVPSCHACAIVDYSPRV